jgi:hypothetical protein
MRNEAGWPNSVPWKRSSEESVVSRIHWVPRSNGSDESRTLGGVERVCGAGGAEGGEGAGGADGIEGADGVEGAEGAEGAEGSRFEGGVGAEQGWTEST